MIVSTVRRSMLQASWRIDARYYSDKGYLAYLRLHNGPWPIERFGDLAGDKHIWMPNIFARVYAADPRFGKPYLTPHDTIRYMPDSDDILSRPQTKNFEQYELHRGSLLVTRSGRNLGPCVWVDRYLEQFVVGEDMIRVTPTDDALVFYAMAFLHTPTGQHLIRRDKNGSVIDHIDAKQLRELTIPLVGDDLRARCVGSFRAAAGLREDARLTLQNAGATFLALTGLDTRLAALPANELRRRYTVRASAVGWRIDAEPHAPLYGAYQRAIKDTGLGQPLRELAHVRKPRGRYSPVYVEDAGYGFPLMSGRQIAQYRPVALKHISPRSFAVPDEYRLEPGWVVMTADGRAEERLADCALITEGRAGWGASGHVHRLEPRSGIHPGLLYLACTADAVQAQLKALATGSVVDALSDTDVREVVVPYPTAAGSEELGDAVVRAWRQLDEAIALEDAATMALEAELTG